jgi:hypothetical protein
VRALSPYEWFLSRDLIVPSFVCVGRPAQPSRASTSRSETSGERLANVAVLPRTGVPRHAIGLVLEKN